MNKEVILSITNTKRNNHDSMKFSDEQSGMGLACLTFTKLYFEVLDQVHDVTQQNKTFLFDKRYSFTGLLVGNVCEKFDFDSNLFFTGVPLRESDTNLNKLQVH
jgi:hypothetical protein